MLNNQSYLAMIKYGMKTTRVYGIEWTSRTCAQNNTTSTNDLQSGMITSVRLNGQTVAAIICRIYPTEFDVSFLGKIHNIPADDVLMPLPIPNLARRINLFRLYSHFKWRQGEWKHLRFVKFGKNNTGVVANDGQIWSGYNFDELEYLFGI